MFKGRGWYGVLGEQLQCHSNGAGGVWEQLKTHQCTPRVARLWDTPIPGGGCGGLRVTLTSLFAVHVGDLLSGLKVRPPQSPSAASPCHHRETAEASLLCLAQLIAQQQEKIKHPSKAWSPVHPKGAPSSCSRAGALCTAVSNLQLPMDHLMHGRPSCSCPEPLRVAQSQHASDRPHVQKCNSRKMYLANTSFHKQQQLGRQSPVLVTSPWKGSHDTGETFSHCPHLMAKV